jgi:CheY-like chemotaxis protein
MQDNNHLPTPPTPVVPVPTTPQPQTLAPVAPQVVAPPVPIAPATPEPVAANIKPKILLVEDDPLLVKMYVTKFGMEGYQIDTAGDGVEGLAKATATKPDFIILDVMMPKMSGTDMLAKLRETEIGKDIPVLVLTNLTKQDEAVKLQALGVKEYLVKAMLTPADVVAKVRQYLGK